MSGAPVSREALERARALAAARLSPARLRHVEGVVETAVRLARRYGEDPERLELAAWLHDLARERDPAQLLEQAERYGWQPSDAERADPVLLHGPVAAAEARATGLTSDGEVLEAVCWHTTARPGLGRFGCLLFLADKIEPGRRYPGVDELRRLAEADWERAMLIALENSIRYCLDNGYWLPDVTVAARNEWLARAGTRRPGAKSSV